jgi:hypothetical protein
LPKSQVFEEQVPARAKEPSKENNHELQQAHMRPVLHVKGSDRMNTLYT